MSAKAKLAEPAKGTSQLVRPRFAPGMLLQDDDLTQAVDYVRDLTRLMFRSFFGCGVICGLRIRAEEQCGKLVIAVEPGVALNCAGDPVQVRTEQKIVLDPTCGEPLPEALCVVMRHHEKCCLPRSAVCEDDEDEKAVVSTRIVDGFEIRVMSECPACACGCAPRGGEQMQQALELQQLRSTGAGSTDQSGVKDAAEAEPAASAREPRLLVQQGAQPDPGCACVDPNDPCYADHYAGKCHCCESEWVILARVCLKQDPQANRAEWVVDHGARRFIRPVLMRDPAPSGGCPGGNGQ